MTTSRAGSSSLSLGKVSRPVMPGILISRKTNSILPFLTCSIAASPEEAVTI
ncbi:MAG: hypothetical protein ABIH50_04170 [bacterium]